MQQIFKIATVILPLTVISHFLSLSSRFEDEMSEFLVNFSKMTVGKFRFEIFSKNANSPFQNI